jgi:hypothetical protein
MNSITAAALQQRLFKEFVKDMEGEYSELILSIK